MLPESAVRIDAKPAGLCVNEWTVRTVPTSHEEDAGIRFQAIIRNESSSELTAIEFGVRYFDSAAKFLGVDEGYPVSDELQKGEDRSISIELAVPPTTSHAAFTVRARRESFFEKHGMMILSALLLALVIYLSAS